MDHYYALCRPFEYGNSQILNNTVKFSFLVCAINVVPSTFKVAISHSAIRIGQLAPFVPEPKYSHLFASVVRCGYFALSTLLPSVETAIVLVWKQELRQMRNRPLTDENKEVNNTTKYIIITFILFYSDVFIVTLHMVIKNHLKSSVWKLVFRIFTFSSIFV